VELEHHVVLVHLTELLLEEIQFFLTSHLQEVVLETTAMVMILWVRVQTEALEVQAEELED
jgi:hypothetical protein